MKTHLITRALAVLSLMIPLAASAQDLPPSVQNWEDDRTQVFDAKGLDLADFVWIARPLVVFADSPNDPNFARQMALLERDVAGLEARDVVLIVDTDPAAKSEIRQKLRPRGFSLVLMDKDLKPVIRKPLPWDVREIVAAIDKFPLRRQEMLERLPAGR